MSKKSRKKKKRRSQQAATSQAASRRRRRRYSAWEIFLAIMGAAVLVLMAGLIITSVLGD